MLTYAPSGCEGCILMRPVKGVKKVTGQVERVGVERRVYLASSPRIREPRRTHSYLQWIGRGLEVRVKFKFHFTRFNADVNH